MGLLRCFVQTAGGSTSVRARYFGEHHKSKLVTHGLLSQIGQACVDNRRRKTTLRRGRGLSRDLQLHSSTVDVKDFELCQSRARGTGSCTPRIWNASFRYGEQKYLLTGKSQERPGIINFFNGGVTFPPQ